MASFSNDDKTWIRLSFFSHLNLVLVYRGELNFDEFLYSSNLPCLLWRDLVVHRLVSSPETESLESFLVKLWQSYRGSELGDLEKLWSSTRHFVYLQQLMRLEIVSVTLLSALSSFFQLFNTFPAAHEPITSME